MTNAWLSEWTIQLVDDIADVASAVGPKNPHKVKLKGTERELLGGIVPMVDAAL